MYQASLNAIGLDHDKSLLHRSSPSTSSSKTLTLVTEQEIIMIPNARTKDFISDFRKQNPNPNTDKSIQSCPFVFDSHIKIGIPEYPFSPIDNCRPLFFTLQFLQHVPRGVIPEGYVKGSNLDLNFWPV